MVAQQRSLRVEGHIARGLTAIEGSCADQVIPRSARLIRRVAVEVIRRGKRCVLNLAPGDEPSLTDDDVEEQPWTERALPFDFGGAVGLREDLGRLQRHEAAARRRFVDAGRACKETDELVPR